MVISGNGERKVPDGDQVVEENDKSENVGKGPEGLIIQAGGVVIEVPRLKGVISRPHEVGHSAENGESQKDEEQEDDLEVGETLHAGSLDWSRTASSKKNKCERWDVDNSGGCPYFAFLKSLVS